MRDVEGSRYDDWDTGAIVLVISRAVIARSLCSLDNWDLTDSEEGSSVHTVADHTTSKIIALPRHI
jgi:hypothetical protein